MAIYTVHCVDHGDNVWHVENIECAADDEAMTEAERQFRSAPIGAGFDLFQGERLILRHRARSNLG
jgi:hypothetical protein